MKRTCLLVVSASLALLAQAKVEPFTVDFSKEVGRIKRLNGVCNATPLSNSRTKSINDQVLKLEIPYYRFHDAALENPGIQLVDIRRIFPLLHADADDPRNYDFRATDDYLKQVIDAGAKIEFRLGESIEHSPKTYLVVDPVDYEKWADVCCHIIRHYNEGWANGFKWDIRYWSIWEEPDTNPQLLTGKPNPFTSIYLPLYAAAVRKIKREFPNLKVGGPQGCGTWHLKEFVDYCAENRLPIDFYGFTGYARDPEDYARMARTARAYLDEKGFKDAEISIAEWHWGPVSWRGHGTVNTPRAAKAWNDELTGHDSTAFTAATLIYMQDAPIDYMYYYAMKCGAWGLFNPSRQPYGSYYSMLAFAQLARGETRVEAMTVPKDRWYVLASKEKATGRGRVLVAALRTDGALTPITLKGGVKPVSVKVIDPIHDLEEVSDWSWNAETCALSVPRDSGDSNVWLIETEPAAGEVPRIAVEANEAGAFPALDWSRATEVRRGVSCLRLAMTRPRLMKAELLRCDLSLFDFAATRRSPNWGREIKDEKTGKRKYAERTQRMSTRDWIAANGDVVVAVNASPWDGGVGQGRPGRMPADPNGFCMSYGELLSDNPCWTNVFFAVRRDGRPDIFCSGKAAPSEADRKDLLHAFMGYGFFLKDGAVLGKRDDLHPRTAYGLSRDRRYLYLLVVDGRQADWSLGANNFDLAQLMIAAGASDGINMDGGGSSAILYRDPGTKRPVQLNRHDAAGAYARPVAINLGLVERSAARGNGR